MMQMNTIIQLYSRGRFIAPTADLSALRGSSAIRMIVLEPVQLHKISLPSSTKIT